MRGHSDIPQKLVYLHLHTFRPAGALCWYDTLELYTCRLSEALVSCRRLFVPAQTYEVWYHIVERY